VSAVTAIPRFNNAPAFEVFMRHHAHAPWKAEEHAQAQRTACSTSLKIKEVYCLFKQPVHKLIPLYARIFPQSYSK